MFRAALEALAGAEKPGYIAESPFEWPDATGARKAWHPPEPPPIVRQMFAQQKP